MKKYLLTAVVLLILVASVIMIGEREYLASEDYKIVVPICKPNKTLEYNRYFKSAGCLIINENSMLLVKKPFTLLHIFDSWKYSIPGGGALPGESAQCAAQRETFEETGIETEAVSIIREYSNNFILFECKPVKPINEKQLTYTKTLEVLKLEWVPFDELATKRLRYESQFDELVSIVKSKRKVAVSAKK